MGNPMKIRAASKDGVTEVKVLMNHEMETGFRKDSSGNLVPAWFIAEVTAKLNGNPVLQGYIRKLIPVIVLWLLVIKIMQSQQ